jgi:xylulokinase
MTKKWTVAGNGPATSGSGNRSRSLSAPGPNPGANFSAKSALASTSLAEEEEEEDGFVQYSGSVTPPRSSKSLLSGSTSVGSMSGSSSGNALLSTNVSPNLALDGIVNGTAVNGAAVGGAGGTGSGHPPMAPIQPLLTDDADTQMGLVKVAEADHDTFLTYAAIVPEFCRLDRMLVNGLVH